MHSDPLSIVSLEIENIKRINAVRVEPIGNLIVVGGENGQGKSSLLDSIMYVLAGRKTHPEVMLREGADSGRVRLDLGSIVAELIVKPDGNPALSLRGDGNRKFSSPQALLDELVGDLAFDPLAFTRQRPQAQADAVARLIGLDLTELNERRAGLYQDRTEAGRDLKKAQATLASMPDYPDAPAVEVSLVELTSQLTSAEAANRTNAGARQHVEQLRQAGASLQAQLRDTQQEIARLQQRQADLSARCAEHDLAYAEATARVACLTDEDPEALRAMVRDTERLNQQVRDQRRRLLFADTVTAQQAEVERLTGEIAAIDAEKALQIAAADYPVEGLGFGSDGGLTYRGLPFSQASSAEQLRVSVALGLAGDRRLPLLLIRDGSLLDPKSLALVAEMAAEKHAQVWVERVSSGDEVQVLIEDGCCGRVGIPASDTPQLAFPAAVVTDRNNDPFSD